MSQKSIGPHSIKKKCLSFLQIYFSLVIKSTCFHLLENLTESIRVTSSLHISSGKNEPK